MKLAPLLLGCVLCGAGSSLGAVAPAAEATAGSAGEVADRARTKVVVLKTRRAGGAGSATGFLVRPGLVLTAAHAVDRTTGVTAWLNGVSYRASVVAQHPDHDLAVLRLEAPTLRLKPLTLALTSELLVEAEGLVILAGPSQGPAAMGEPTLRVAIPATFSRRLRQRDPNGRVDTVLSMRASIRRGDSGSPVLRIADGSVVGVLSARELPDETGVSRFAFAVPVEAVNRWLDDVADREQREAESFYLDRRPR